MDADPALSCGRCLNLLDSVAADKTPFNVFFIMSCFPPTYPSGLRVFDIAKIHNKIKLQILYAKFLTLFDG